MAKTRQEKTLLQALPESAEVRAEYQRLLDLFAGAKPEKIALARKLMSRAAFLSVTCDNLEVEIARKGVKEAYKNGENQYGFKRSIAADVYAVYSKNLFAVMRQLSDLLDVAVSAAPQGGDAFDTF